MRCPQNKTVEARERPSTHVIMRRARPGLKKRRRVRPILQTILVLFMLAYATLVVIIESPDIIGVVWHKLTAV